MKLCSTLLVKCSSVRFPSRLESYSGSRIFWEFWGRASRICTYHGSISAGTRSPGTIFEADKDHQKRLFLRFLTIFDREMRFRGEKFLQIRIFHRTPVRLRYYDQIFNGKIFWLQNNAQLIFEAWLFVKNGKFCRNLFLIHILTIVPSTNGLLTRNSIPLKIFSFRHVKKIAAHWPESVKWR